MQANILQPLTHVCTLSLRYDAVEELLASEELLVDVAQGLLALPRDLDKVCRGLARTQKCTCCLCTVSPGLCTLIRPALSGSQSRHTLAVMTCTRAIAAREIFSQSWRLHERLPAGPRALWARW